MLALDRVSSRTSNTSADDFSAVSNIDAATSSVPVPSAVFADARVAPRRQRSNDAGSNTIESASPHSRSTGRIARLTSRPRACDRDCRDVDVVTDQPRSASQSGSAPPPYRHRAPAQAKLARPRRPIDHLVSRYTKRRVCDTWHPIPPHVSGVVRAPVVVHFRRVGAECLSVSTVVGTPAG